MPNGNPRTRAEGEKLKQEAFQGIMIERTAHLQDDVKEIKRENIRQWEAIDKAKWWNKIGSAIALAALAIAAKVGLGGKS